MNDLLLQLRPRQAILLNMMYALAACVMNGDSTGASVVLRSCLDFATALRLISDSEIQELTNKISNIRGAFTTEELAALGITAVVQSRQDSQLNGGH